MRRERRVILALVGLAAVCLAAWWAFARLGREAEDETWARIREEGVLRVGLDPSWPPFEYVEDGQIVGFDVDLAREIGRRLGVEVVLVNVGFDALYDALQVGRFDAIVSALPYDPARTKDVAYSISYFNAGQVLVVRADEGQIKGVKDLAGRRLGVEWGSEGDAQARKLQKKIKGLTLRPYMAPEEALRALKSGQVDAALVDAVSALQFMGREGGVKIVGHPLTDELYVIAVRPESHALLRAINEALAEMREDGTLARLRERWLGARSESPGSARGAPSSLIYPLSRGLRLTVASPRF